MREENHCEIRGKNGVINKKIWEYGKPQEQYVYAAFSMRSPLRRKCAVKAAHEAYRAGGVFPANFLQQYFGAFFRAKKIGEKSK